MKFRIEFTKPNSSAVGVAWVLRLCRQVPTFKETVEDGLTVYSVEWDGNQIPAFVAILERVQGWKNMAVFIDGNIVSRGECWKRLDEFTRERRMGYRRVQDLLREIAPEEE